MQLYKYIFIVCSNSPPCNYLFFHSHIWSLHFLFLVQLYSLCFLFIGLVASCVLIILLQISAEEAISIVLDTRKGTILAKKQEEFIISFRNFVVQQYVSLSSFPFFLLSFFFTTFLFLSFLNYLLAFFRDKKTPCRFGTACTRADCRFLHEKPSKLKGSAEVKIRCAF